MYWQSPSLRAADFHRYTLTYIEYVCVCVRASLLILISMRPLSDPLSQRLALCIYCSITYRSLDLVACDKPTFFFLLVLFCGAHNFFLNYYFINFDNTLAGVSSSAMRLLLVCYLCICLLLYTHIYHQLLCKFLICFPWPLHMKRCPFHIGLLVVVIFGQ